MKRKAIIFLKVSGLSLLLFLATCWTAGISFSLAAGVESICFLLITWYFCYRYSVEQVSQRILISAIIFGRIIVEIPVRLSDLSGTAVSLPVLIICILSIPLGVLCFNKRNKFIWSVCIGGLVLASIFVPYLWFRFHNQILP